jgi:hypothetical protein
MLRAALIAAVMLATALAATAQTDEARAELAKRRRRALLEAGKRHLEVGVWCRDSGLVPQATSEFLAAVEVSEDEHPGARKVLSLMQRLDERFWKLEKKKPGKALLDSYEQKAKTAHLADQKGRFAVAEHADRSKLKDEALAEYVALAKRSEKEIECDADGRIVLVGGVVPKGHSDAIKADAVTINGKLYVRDAFLTLIPHVKTIFETASPELLLRSETSAEEAQALHDLGSALLPHLAMELDARPTRRPQIFVFATHESYQAYLKGSGKSGHAAAAGVAESGTGIAVFASAGRPAQTLHEILLHELTHVYDMSVHRAILPSWYSEAFAETFGGTGTFEWDGKTLRVKGVMARRCIEPLASGQMIALRDLIAANALELIRANKELAALFYAQSWAFRRFLHDGAPPEITKRFRAWEVGVRGAAVGAQAGQRDSRNQAPAAQLFENGFGAELPQLEEGFKAYLEKLAK